MPLIQESFLQSAEIAFLCFINMLLGFNFPTTLTLSNNILFIFLCPIAKICKNSILKPPVIIFKHILN